MRTVLQRVLTQVRVTAPDPRDEAIKPSHITLVPKHGARLTVTSM
jgi:hypothetical protein